MPDPTRELETNEELLAEEIKDLERPFMASWQTWAMALVGFATLALIVAAFMIWEAANISRKDAERTAAAPPVSMALHTLRQGLEADPRFFRWEPVTGASSYVFIVRDDDPGGDVLIIRSVAEPVLITTDVESANLTTGKFVWSLEARRVNGTRIGYGEGTFTID